MGDNFKFVKENTDVKVLSYKGSVFGVEAPQLYGTAGHPDRSRFKGDTATNRHQTRRFETGAEIKVPLFINEGDMIRVDTRTGEYMERA